MEVTMVQRAAAEKLRTDTVKPTGLGLLDKALGGGLSPGSVVYMLSDAAANAEVLLFHFTQPKKTFYFATVREPKYIVQDIKHLGFEVSNIEFVDIFSAAHHHSLKNSEISNEEQLDYKVLDFVESRLKDIKERDVAIIFDAFHILPMLNVKRNNIIELMHMIYNTAKENDAIVYLFSLSNTMDSRMENELMGYCDVVFDMRFMRHEDKITNELAITKARNIEVAYDIIKFFVKGKVVIDSSEVVV